MHMAPEIAYLAAYTIVCDEKIYDEEWVMLEQFVKSFAYDEECKRNILSIIGDTEDKPSLDSIISSLKNNFTEDKEIALQLSVRIAFVDGFYSDCEKRFLQDVAIKLGLQHSMLNKFEKEAEDMLSNQDQIELTKRKGGAKFYKFLSQFGSKRFSDQMLSRYRQCLLSGKDYADTIKKMRSIAAEDIVFSRNAIISLTNQLETFNQHLNSRSSSIKNHFEKLAYSNNDKAVDVDQHLDELKKSISLLTDDIRTEAQETLKKKEESIDRYTISFMGRTKAGKSTLHSVILGGINREFIGKGMERTTRYNRVYQWNGIRIIDTPGIGAPGGKSDTEIAKSVIEESDMICYVVTTDSIQETEFNFLGELKNQNKPVIILLNKKENFDRTQSTREKFLKDPLLWYTRKDKDDIRGHIDRITEYVQKHFSNVYLKIYPVQLKAAQLAIAEDDSSLKKKYLAGSRINQFLDEIRVQIQQVGILKRSQTIINGTLYRLYDGSEKLSAHYVLLKELLETFESKGNESVKKIKKAGEIAEKNLKKGLDAVFSSFINEDLLEFAQDNYDMGKDDLNRELKHFVVSKGFENRMKTRMEKEIENYKAQVREILTTFSENMEFTFDSMKRIDINIGGVFDTKFYVSLGGGLIGLAGSIVLLVLGASNPIGWVLTGAGIVIGLISNLFKSKERKIKEAQEELYDTLSREFSKYQDDAVQKMVSEFAKIHTNVTNNVSLTFTSISDGLRQIIEHMNLLMKTIETNKTELNNIYAARILNYCAKKTVVSLDDEKALRTLSVTHEFGKRMEICYPGIKQLKINNKSISEILQEDIVFISTK